MSRIQNSYMLIIFLITINIIQTQNIAKSNLPDYQNTILLQEKLTLDLNDEDILKQSYLTEINQDKYTKQNPNINKLCTVKNRKINVQQYNNTLLKSSENPHKIIKLIDHIHILEYDQKNLKIFHFELENSKNTSDTNNNNNNNDDDNNSNSLFLEISHEEPFPTPLTLNLNQPNLQYIYEVASHVYLILDHISPYLYNYNINKLNTIENPVNFNENTVEIIQFSNYFIIKNNENGYFLYEFDTEGRKFSTQNQNFIELLKNNNQEKTSLVINDIRDVKKINDSQALVLTGNLVLLVDLQSSYKILDELYLDGQTDSYLSNAFQDKIIAAIDYNDYATILYEIQVHENKIIIHQSKAIQDSFRKIILFENFYLLEDDQNVQAVYSFVPKTLLGDKEQMEINDLNDIVLFNQDLNIMTSSYYFAKGKQNLFLVYHQKNHQVSIIQYENSFPKLECHTGFEKMIGKYAFNLNFYIKYCPNLQQQQDKYDQKSYCVQTKKINLKVDRVFLDDEDSISLLTILCIIIGCIIGLGLIVYLAIRFYKNRIQQLNTEIRDLKDSKQKKYEMPNYGQMDDNSDD